jgi:allantoinase
VNPPIRPKDQVEALWGHVAAGRVDFVSSDHVAWSLDRKANHENFFRNSSGVPGLETLLPAFFTGVERRGLPLTLVPRMLSGGAARHFCLAEKGRLAPGADADFVVLEPGKHRYSVKHAQGAAEWSPFDGMEFSVRVRDTFVRGKQVWDGKAGKVTATAGQGRFVPATLPAKAVQ